MDKMMMKRSENFSVFLCWTFLISSHFVGAIETGKTPLNVDNPISGTPGENKDGKILDTRYNDPPPEYYKGPPSVSDRDRYDSYDLKYNGLSHKPLPNIGSSGHINPYLSKHGFYGPGSTKDRINVNGYYGSGGGGDHGGNGYSSYERNRPYGPPQAVDISSSANHGYYDSYDNQNGLDWQQNNYGGAWNDKLNYLSKSNFIPIAGAALLGIAAALVVNPVLLQLGTVAGKRRRRRDTAANQPNVDGDNAHPIAYRNQKRATRESIH